LKLEQKAEILRSCKFLAGAKEDILLALADESGILEVPGGDTVVTKGDPGSTMYFIASGKARDHDGDSVVISIRDTAESFDAADVETPHLETSLREREFGGMGVFMNGFATESAPTNNLRCTVLL